jgi:predicted nucleic acid-binding protein
VSEPGARQASAAWAEAERVVSSRLLYPEARAAVARAHRDTRITTRQLREARAQVDRLWRGLERIDVTAGVARAAGDLAEGHALRAYDAVHLASALSLADDELALVSADRRLLDAAAAAGLNVAPV